MMSDVDHPSHYQGNGIEVIDVINGFDLNFYLGNVIKYVLRAGKKEDKSLDLKKALWYLEKQIEKEMGRFSSNKPIC